MGEGAEEISAADFEAAVGLVYRESGIRLSDAKRPQAAARIRRAAGARPAAFVAAACARRGPERAALLDAVTVQETSFFRTARHFDWFEREFLPEAVAGARRGGREKRLRVWSAACSTGQEPYSLAILIAENRLRMPDWRVDLLATDVSAQAVAAAEAGVYPERKLGGLGEKRLRRHFRVDAGRAEARQKLREAVTFQTGNLMRPPAGPWDCVWLRNVLIYFDGPSKAAAVEAVAGEIAPGGYLVLGPSEGVTDPPACLRRVETFLYRKDAP